MSGFGEETVMRKVLRILSVVVIAVLMAGCHRRSPTSPTNGNGGNGGDPNPPPQVLSFSPAVESVLTVGDPFSFKYTFSDGNHAFVQTALVVNRDDGASSFLGGCIGGSAGGRSEVITQRNLTPNDPLYRFGKGHTIISFSILVAFSDFVPDPFLPCVLIDQQNPPTYINWSRVGARTDIVVNWQIQ